jgi:hypothetical protein
MVEPERCSGPSWTCCDVNVMMTNSQYAVAMHLESSYGLPPVPLFAMYHRRNGLPGLLLGYMMYLDEVLA